jgi:hypothetical protein
LLIVVGFNVVVETFCSIDRIVVVTVSFKVVEVTVGFKVVEVTVKEKGGEKDEKELVID